MTVVRKLSSAAAVVCALSGTSLPLRAQPFHDPIPREFIGTFAPKLSDCADPEGVEIIRITADQIHYYEGDDYLLLGVAFSGASTKSGSDVSLFNGRFTSRNLDQLLGETNVRMEMETPNTLLRYGLKSDGDPSSAPVTTWFRCPQ